MTGSRTRPDWGTTKILETDHWAADGYDVIVEGDGKDLEEHIASRRDLFMRCERVDRPTREYFEKHYKQH